MKDFLKNLFNHERYQVISILLAAGLLIYFYGCQPKVPSIINPNNEISRAELDIEVENFIARANFGYASLTQQEALRQMLFEQAMIAASTGAFNPVAMMTSVGAILGIGATVDNVRKRKRIKVLENGK